MGLRTVGIALLALVSTAAASTAAVAPPAGGVPGDPVRITAQDESTGYSAISLDGSTVVYGVGPWASTTDVRIRPSTGGPWTSIIPEPFRSAVTWVGFDPSGKYALYLADIVDTDDGTELYSYRLEDGAIARLSGDLPSAGAYDGHTFVPAMESVVFVGHDDISDTTNLYLARLDGSELRTVHPDFEPGGSANHNFFAMPAIVDTSIVYLAKTSRNAPTGVFVSSLVKNDTRLLSPEGVDVERFTVSRDDSTVVWTTADVQRRQLYSVALSGGDSTPLGPRVFNGGKVHLLFMPHPPINSVSYILYTVRYPDDTPDEVHAIKPNGNSHRRLDAIVPTAFWVRAISPVDDRVVVQTEDALVGVDLASKDATRLTPSDPAGSYPIVEFSPDGRHVVYTVQGDSAGHLYSADLDGNYTSITEILPTTRGIGGRTITSDIFEFTPDGRFAFWVLWGEWESRYTAVYSVNADGSGLIALADDTGDVVELMLASKSSRLLADGENGLWTVAVRNYRCGGQRATHVGSAGADTLRGTPGRDVMVGLNGDDTIFGRGGHDVICAGGGADIVSGGTGRDRVFGQTGKDVLRGNRGPDRLFGGRHADMLHGGPGDDKLYGGPGTDTCNGGTGTDIAEGCAP